MDSKVKIAFCIFTYGDDAWMVGQCVRALRKLGANRSNVFIFDDAYEPLPYPIPNTQYRQTTFKRNGNLNGNESVDGQLLSMLEASKESNAHLVIKVDSDTIINNLDWVLNEDFMNSHIGFKICNKSHLCGGAYSLPTWALIPMLRRLSHYPYEPDKGESIFMTELAKEVGLSQIGYDCSTIKQGEIWRCSSLLDKSLTKDGKLESHAYGVMKNLDVVLCDLIADKRDKQRNYLLMKNYLDLSEF